MSLSLTEVPGLGDRGRRSSETAAVPQPAPASFEPGARRRSMLASLRLLEPGARSGEEDGRPGVRRGEAHRRSSADPPPSATGATGQHQRARRRGSLVDPSSDRADRDAAAAPAKRPQRSRRKTLSVPDILEEEAVETAAAPGPAAGGGRRAASLGGVPLLSARSKSGRAGLRGLAPLTRNSDSSRAGFLSTGINSGTASTFRTRMQKARKARRKKLLLKFKSYSRLVVFLHRLCKNHFLSVDDQGNSYRGKYISDDQTEEILFDVRYFRANKEAGISPECKKILSLPTHQRTERDHYRALIALRNFPTFAEFPLVMQQEIVKVGWYERYQAQRVILRQGHRPLNFYFIMTGSVVVRVLEEGSDNPRTVVYLNRGETFGELGLVNRERRQSTVISRDKVELLCIGDEDYTRIFMAGGLKMLLDPNQSDFVRNLTFLEGWPMHLLAENPKKCIFSYFKRGDVLVKNSKKSDWILIVKSGSCSVMKLLHRKKAKVRKKRKKSDTVAPDLATEGRHQGQGARDSTLESYQQRKTRDEFEHFLQDLNIHEDGARGSGVGAHAKRGERPVADGGGGAPAADGNGAAGSRRPGRPVLPSQNSSVHLSRLPSHAARQKDAGPEESQHDLAKQNPLGQKKTIATEIVDDIVNEGGGTEAVWVQIQILTKGSYFGLSDMLFDSQPSFSVISNGAECILVSKKLYREHTTQVMLTRLRREEQSYPDDKELQRNLEVKFKWDAFRRNTLLGSLNGGRKRSSLQR